MTLPFEMQNLWAASLTALVLWALPIGVLAAWRRRTGAPLGPVVAGALGFLLFSKMLEGAVHVFCLVRESPLSQAIWGSPALFILYGCSMAGIFEEVGRYCVFRLLLKKPRPPQTALSYGIGHGGVEVWVNMALPVLLQAAAGALALWQGGAAGQALSIARGLEGFTWAYGLLVVVERLGAMAVHLALSVVVFWAVRARHPAALALAILLHGVVDIPPGLHQYGLLSLPATEVAFLLLCGCVCALGLLYWRKLQNGEDGRKEQTDV